ncbi:hypothetical protein HPC49_29590 [Pyxidicoccus fallax]|uniref:Lipoprotein n=1 Tax=Pyxidicoccus fallax TaxID=394095 RepID=A0A848LZQ2_9BACT|nr:hypothetical protein [Pyxidicoccus fallax]NMO23101.1 hypothetical protein [Pyxidicoccus fallax]NPC82361.1 hypothetical protein [Pyxidicoccus fallax]
MRSKLFLPLLGMSLALGLSGCGVEDEATPAEEFLGSVDQPIYNARCQTDYQGYQTGRCLDMNALATCRLVNYTPPRTGCTSGKRPTSTPSAICNTYINSNYCQDPPVIEP